MAHIIKDNEYKVRCRNCHRMVGFGIHDVFSTYMRGLDHSSGWFDGDSVWHYVKCPECGHMIYVGNVLSEDDDEVCRDNFLERKLDD